MGLISLTFDANVQVRRYKAPRGKMYRIYDIHASIQSGGDNMVLVLPYFLEDGITELALASGPIDALAAIPANIAGTFFDWQFTLGEKTKYLTCVRRTTTNFTMVIIIHFELISVSKTELIMEWFRHGR